MGITPEIKKSNCRRMASSLRGVRYTGAFAPHTSSVGCSTRRRVCVPTNWAWSLAKCHQGAALYSYRNDSTDAEADG